jgi:hypothetical protein
MLRSAGCTGEAYNTSMIEYILYSETLWLHTAGGPICADGRTASGGILDRKPRSGGGVCVTDRINITQ